MTRRITKLALLFVIAFFMTSFTFGQTPESDEAATAGFLPQVQFAGQEPYEVNGIKGTRYKLSVTNRTDHPDFFWWPSGKPCGTNENAARTWVEVFGSPGDKRLAGFCGLRSSEDLAHLWFPVQSGEKGPQCVYIVMTDQKTGKKYESNRTCSRSFTVVRGRSKSDSQQAAPIEQWMQLENAQASTGRKPVMIRKEIDLNTPTSLPPQVMKSDLLIKQFLFPPTNDKALRVHVVNKGQGPSVACRLVLTVRKINGVAVGRKAHVNVPALAAGADDWLHIDVKSILPNNISLTSTTFKLNVDATGLIAESDEGNNEVWHNL